MSPMYEYMCIGNYATVFDEIWQDDLTEMLSNLNRGGKDTRIPNSNLYWDPTAAKLKKCEHTDKSESGYLFSATLQ